MTIVAGLLMLLFSRLIGRGRIGARWAALAAVIGIALYAVLVGGGASVVRAAIMGGLALLAGQLGRPQDRRGTLVQLTEKGLQFIDRAVEVHVNNTATWINKTGHTEMYARL